MIRLDIQSLSIDVLHIKIDAVRMTSTPVRVPDRTQLAMIRRPGPSTDDHDDRQPLRSRPPTSDRLACGAGALITASQLRAARALAGMDQKTLAEKAGVSLPTIQRMEASLGNVRGVVDTLTKIINALDAAGVELIGENKPSYGSGRGVRLKSPPSDQG